MKSLKTFFPEKIQKKEAMESGMALTLIFLLLGYFLDRTGFYNLAIPALILAMAWPEFYKPFAYLWLGITTLLGTIISKLILTIVFLIFVIPVGLIRKALRKDNLRLKQFKKSDKSVMIKRNHIFVPSDIEKPY